MAKATILVLALAALAGCQQQHPDEPTQFDQKYLRDLYDQDQDSIQIAKVAAGKASEEHLRVMASNSVKRDEQQQSQILSWLINWYGQTYTAHTTEEGRRRLDQLLSLSGSDFDRQYLKDMIAHYEREVEMSRSEVTRAGHPEVRDFAQAL